MEVYIAIKQTDLTFTCFNSVKALAQYLNVDARTIKNYLNLNKLIKKEYIIASTNLIKFTRKRKKGFNVSLTAKKVHNEDNF
jgi:hypothetical protein